MRLLLDSNTSWKYICLFKKSQCSFKPRMIWLKNIGIPCVIDLLDILEFTYLLQKMIYLYTGEGLGESQRVKSV